MQVFFRHMLMTLVLFFQNMRFLLPRCQHTTRLSYSFQIGGYHSLNPCRCQGSDVGHVLDFAC